MCLEYTVQGFFVANKKGICYTQDAIVAEHMFFCVSFHNISWSLTLTCLGNFILGLLILCIRCLGLEWILSSARHAFHNTCNLTIFAYRCLIVFSLLSSILYLTEKCKCSYCFCKYFVIHDIHWTNLKNMSNPALGFLAPMRELRQFAVTFALLGDSKTWHGYCTVFQSCFLFRGVH